MEQATGTHVMPIHDCHKAEFALPGDHALFGWDHSTTYHADYVTNEECHRMHLLPQQSLVANLLNFEIENDGLRCATSWRSFSYSLMSLRISFEMDCTAEVRLVVRFKSNAEHSPNPVTVCTHDVSPTLASRSRLQVIHIYNVYFGQHFEVAVAGIDESELSVRKLQLEGIVLDPADSISKHDNGATTVVFTHQFDQLEFNARRVSEMISFMHSMSRLLRKHFDLELARAFLEFIQSKFCSECLKEFYKNRLASSQVDELDRLCYCDSKRCARSYMRSSNFRSILNNVEVQHMIRKKYQELEAVRDPHSWEHNPSGEEVGDEASVVFNMQKWQWRERVVGRRKQRAIARQEVREYDQLADRLKRFCPKCKQVESFEQMQERLQIEEFERAKCERSKKPFDPNSCNSVCYKCNRAFAPLFKVNIGQWNQRVQQCEARSQLSKQMMITQAHALQQEQLDHVQRTQRKLRFSSRLTNSSLHNLLLKQLTPTGIDAVFNLRRNIGDADKQSKHRSKSKKHKKEEQKHNGDMARQKSVQFMDVPATNGEDKLADTLPKVLIEAPAYESPHPPQLVSSEDDLCDALQFLMREESTSTDLEAGVNKQVENAGQLYLSSLAVSRSCFTVNENDEHSFGFDEDHVKEFLVPEGMVTRSPTRSSYLLGRSTSQDSADPSKPRSRRPSTLPRFEAEVEEFAQGRTAWYENGGLLIDPSLSVSVDDIAGNFLSTSINKALSVSVDQWRMRASMDAEEHDHSLERSIGFWKSGLAGIVPARCLLLQEEEHTSNSKVSDFAEDDTVALVRVCCRFDEEKCAFVLWNAVDLLETVEDGPGQEHELKDTSQQKTPSPSRVGSKSSVQKDTLDTDIRFFFGVCRNGLRGSTTVFAIPHFEEKPLARKPWYLESDGDKEYAECAQHYYMRSFKRCEYLCELQSTEGQPVDADTLKATPRSAAQMDWFAPARLTPSGDDYFLPENAIFSVNRVRADRIGRHVSWCSNSMPGDLRDFCHELQFPVRLLDSRTHETVYGYFSLFSTAVRFVLPQLDECCAAMQVSVKQTIAAIEEQAFSRVLCAPWNVQLGSVPGDAKAVVVVGHGEHIREVHIKDVQFLCDDTEGKEYI